MSNAVSTDPFAVQAEQTPAPKKTVAKKAAPTPATPLPCEQCKETANAVASLVTSHAELAANIARSNQLMENVINGLNIVGQQQQAMMTTVANFVNFIKQQGPAGILRGMFKRGGNGTIEVVAEESTDGSE